MALLSCEALSVGYEGRAIVQNIGFSVERGEYLCIVGENGSGKTTLMKTLLGLRPPLSGQIMRGDGLCGGQIGYLPQKNDIQRDFPASVREIVLSGCVGRCGAFPFFRRADRERAAAAMEKMELNGLSGRSFRELSGGQQQRVLLARALCASEQLLLLDEPVSGLDPQMSAKMYRLIEKLNREDGMAVIMITHDIAAALHYATHILHIGSHLFFGTREEYSAREYPQGAPEYREIPSGGEDRG